MQLVAVSALSVAEIVVLAIFSALAGQSVLNGNLALAAYTLLVPLAVVFYLALRTLNSDSTGWEHFVKIGKTVDEALPVKVYINALNGLAALLIASVFIVSVLYAVWLALVFRSTSMGMGWYVIFPAVIGPVLGVLSAKPSLRLFRSLKEWFLNPSLSQNQMARHH